MNHHHNHSHNHHHHNHLPPPVISLLSSSSDESSDDDDDIQIVSVTQPSRPLAVVLDDDDDDDDDIEIVSVKLAPTPSRPYHRSPSLTAPPSKFPKFSKSSSTRNSTFPPNSLLNSPSRESPLKIEKIQPPTPNEPIDLDTPPEPQPPPLVIPPISLYPSGLQLSKHQDFNNKRHGPHSNLTCSIQDILQGKSGEYGNDSNNAGPDLVATLQFTHTIEPLWFLSNLPSSTTDVTVAYEKLETLTESDEAKASNSRAHVKPNLIQIQPPPLGSHNTKMMILLFSDDSIKVVIHTGNLIEHDWRSKTLAIYTTPFLHFKSPSTPPATSDALQHSPSSDFERMLLQYLDSYGDERVNEWRKRLEKYDFGECRAMLIPSVPGIHTGSSLNDYGMNRLKQIVEQQDQSRKRYVPEVSREGVVVQIPSLSNLHPAEYSDSWLLDFLHALTHSKSHFLQRTEHKSDFPQDSEILPDSESMQGLMTNVIIQLNESESEERLNSVPSDCMLRKYLKDSSNQTCPPCLSLSPNSQMTTMTQFLIPSSSSSRNPLSSVSSTLASDQLSDNPQLQDATVHLSYHLFTSADLSKSSWGVPVLRRAGLSIRNWDMGVAVCDSLFKSKYHNKIYLVPSSSPLLQPPPSQTSFSSSQSPSTSQPHQIPPFPYPLPPLPPFPSRSSPLNSPSPPSLSSLFVSNPQSSTSSSSGSSSTYFSTIPSSTINSTQPSSPFPSSSAPSPFLASDGPVLIVPIPMSIPITSSSPSPVKFEKM